MIMFLSPSPHLITIFIHYLYVYILLFSFKKLFGVYHLSIENHYCSEPLSLGMDLLAASGH